jgi:NADH-quinone oxidoreductase subunit D
MMSGQSYITREQIADDRVVLNIGPQHPATHGTLRFVMELDGEVVRKCRPVIGYLHTGFEKWAEHHTFRQFVPLTDRLNYLSPLANNISYVASVEKLFDVEITERQQYIRVVLAELTRIADHCVSVGASALDIGALTVFVYLFQMREHILDIFEMTTGARMTNSYFRPGGSVTDVPPGFEEACREFAKIFPRTLRDVDGLLTHNRIWLDRTRGVGVLEPEDALDWGVTGPALRGSGVPYDVRKSEPYYVYDRFDWEVVVSGERDVYGRFLVRMEEMRQSLRIVEQAVARIPDGPFNVSDAKMILPPKEETYGTIEGLIHHFEQIMPGKGPYPERGLESYVPTEAPNGELGFYILSDGTSNPYRLRCRPPSLINFQIFPSLIEGGMLSDTVAILGSLNIIAGELDR